MKRRSFLKSILGFMVAPFLPKSKAKAIFKPVSSYSSYEIKEAAQWPISEMPLSDDMEPQQVKLKMTFVTRIINDKSIRFEPSIKPLFVDLDPYPPKFKKVEGIEHWAVDDWTPVSQQEKMVKRMVEQQHRMVDKLIRKRRA